MAAEEVVLRRLKTSKDIGKFMSDYYHELDAASKSGKQKIAWCTSVGPAEILRGMGFLIYFPETHSAMLGSTRMATELIPKANAIGYSPEICSYLTADIGAFLQGVTPLSKAFPGIESIPGCDVLVYNTNQCRDVQDWFAWYSRKFGVPSVGIETHRNVGTVTDTHVSSIVGQMESLVEPLEKIAGRRLDMDELKHAVALSRQCSDLWEEVLATAAAVPSPLTFFDGTTLMGPAVVGRGTQKAIDVYKLLLEELNERIAQGVGAIGEEKYRIYWDGMPVWGRLGPHSKLFAGLKANVIASTYCSSWIFSALDPEKPMESMARAYTELFIVRSDEYKENYIKGKLELFHCDGIIYHDAKTCPNNSNCRYGLPQRLQAQTNIPALMINGDLNDLRLLSDEQTKTNIEAFIEQLEESKA
ncbi:2-hydroxyacyl-CoA dehydratase subunit D [Desulforhabdus sp. TSK]|uniref:2-hydroxyacyl-CoA dehydratase subunit D n=1 Tax=Desulforhabdus sp. TSK TaxID=2925014 RepID=UPI001FC8E552|nr:2-hydroxyacyl-CoA dehydratase family protein [Desulforhabdus sp. TSK]GKT08932.1 2-hydroxyglutaryl-CoA dehydratase [Desulforhabdus sp. TSK]